ncbi:hypothetical protein OT109_01465 [Phycisphaeraceae bacterium D3-23]
MQVFGRSGQELIPLLADGAKGIDALRAEAKRLGLTISDETARKAAKLTDAIGKLKLQAKVAAINIGAALAPSLIKVFNLLTKAGKAAIDFTKKYGKVIAITAAVAGGVLALGGALTTLGVGVGLLGFALAGIVSGLAVVASALASIAVPATIAIALVGGLGVALFKFTNVFHDTAGFIKRELGVLVNVAKQTINGIRDAVAGADILLAVRILWVNLQIAFLQGTQGLREKWIDFKTGFLKASEEAGAGAVGVFNNLFAALQNISIRIVGAFGLAWVNLLAGAEKVFNEIVHLAKREAVAIRVAFDPRFSRADGQAAKDQLALDYNTAQRIAGDTRQSRVAALDQAQAALLNHIEDERVAREDAISQALASELAAIQTAADADKARIQGRIDALRAERQELEQQAAGARLVAQAIERARDLLRGGNGPGFGPEIDGLGDGIAAQVQAASIAARGVTSSFSIRSLDSGGGNGLNANVKGIAAEVKQIGRDMKDVAIAARGSSGLAIV